ncbi:MAG: glucose-6-phosphate isomerase [Gemmatimonadetes bacterium]|nr:glucose-6-phosphate isomerase [Gemmatimonadota bacterium]
MRLDYSRMLQDQLDGDHGLSAGVIDRLTRRYSAVQAEVATRREGGEYGFYALADQAETVAQIETFAEGLGQAHEDVIVLGIGGSALGTKALLGALRGPGWNEWNDEAREYYPRLHVLDNIDPSVVHNLLQRVDPRRALVNVISKSGNTAETLAQYLVVRAWLEDALGEAATRHLVFTTDPASGALREIATRESIATLDVPPSVGGRFSVLSPVGLLPLALVGIDIAALLSGAAQAIDQAAAAELEHNQAALFAGLMWAADTTAGSRIQVLMPYSDRLREFGSWFCQLWAESLGKKLDRQGTVVHAGPTPLAAVGATDQHSLVQLLMEGPYDKVVSFITVEDPGCDVPIPDSPDLPEAAAYLAGHTLGGLLDAEYQATARALAGAGRMNLTLGLPDLAPATVGELVMFFQLAVGYAGVWYGVDPFDQPGVELGKRLTFAAMGRPGYDTAQPAREPASMES